MKILTFSDWRVQSLPILKEIIKKECPELILYAGDDLHRFLGFDKRYLKIKEKSIKNIGNFINPRKNNIFKK